LADAVKYLFQHGMPDHAGKLVRHPSKKAALGTVGCHTGGKSEPGLTHLAAYCVALKISPYYLLGIAEPTGMNLRQQLVRAIMDDLTDDDQALVLSLAQGLERHSKEELKDLEARLGIGAGHEDAPAPESQ
jgi:hypothetical protein